MSQVISILNFKGGTGKTTTAINLCGALALKKKTVLLIDLDPQCNATLHLNFLPEDGETIWDSLVDKTLNTPLPIYSFTKNFDFVPSSMSLSEANELLVARIKKEEILSYYIKSMEEEYDYIIIDCPPQPGILNTNALCASQKIIIPINGQYSLQGLTNLNPIIATVKKFVNHQLEEPHFLCTLYDARLRDHKDVRQEARDEFGNRVLNTIIRRNTELEKTPKHHQTIFEFSPSCPGAEDYMQLAQEIIKKWK